MFILSIVRFSLQYGLWIYFNMKKVFYEKRCSNKLHKIHRKTPVPKSFFNKIAGLRTAALLKKRCLSQVLSCEFCEMYTNTLFENTSGRLLLILFVTCFLYFPFPLDWNSPCHSEGASHQEVSNRVRQREELNWASQLKSSGQQIFSRMSCTDSPFD